MSRIQTIGLVTKHKVPEAKKLGAEVAAFLKSKGCGVFFDTEPSKLVKRSDLIVVLGGDGTFLGVARRMSARSVPILGVNMGQLGFLTEVKKAEVFEALKAAIQGKLPIHQRTMLECTLKRKSKVVASSVVVNDVVVSKGAIARIFDMQVLVNGSLVTNIKADGLIVSTPTGSTAYCLAAGGPIVTPDVAAMVVAPICPHSVTLRPLVIPDDSEVTINSQHKSGSVVLTLDGQSSYDLRPGDSITITKFKKHKLRILGSKDRDYFSLLREKLKFGYRD